MSLSTSLQAPAAVPLRMEPTTVAMAKAPTFTGVGRSKLYELAAVGEIDLIKSGRSTLLDVASWRRYLARQPRAVIRPRAAA